MTEGAREYPPVGSLADEATKLADVAQGWLRARSMDGDPWAAATDHSDGAPECREVGEATVDAGDPEVLGHLSDAVGSLGAAIAAMSRNRKTGAT